MKGIVFVLDRHNEAGIQQDASSGHAQKLRPVKPSTFLESSCSPQCSALSSDHWARLERGRFSPGSGVTGSIVTWTFALPNGTSGGRDKVSFRSLRISAVTLSVVISPLFLCAVATMGWNTPVSYHGCASESWQLSSGASSSSECAGGPKWCDLSHGMASLSEQHRGRNGRRARPRLPCPILASMWYHLRIPL